MSVSFLSAHELSDLLDQAGLVDHERNLGDDDSLTVGIDRLDVRPGTHDNSSPDPCDRRRGFPLGRR